MHPPRRRRGSRDAQSGASPIIGTILILAVTAIAIPTTLMVGAPLLRDLREEAALERMTVQLEGVRAAALALNVADTTESVPLEVPSGTLGVVEGTMMAVSIQMDVAAAYSDCDRRPSLFTDGDDEIRFDTATGTTCRPIDAGGTCSNVCVAAYRIDDGEATEVTVNTGSAPLLRLGEDIDPSVEYKFLFHQGDLEDDVILGATWLLPSQRVQWTEGGSVAAYEHGGLVSARDSAGSVTQGPRLAEDAGPDDAFFLRLITLEGSGGTGGAQSVRLSLIAVYVERLATDEDATRVRIDLAGANAEAWCQVLVARNTQAQLEAPDPIYREDPLATCSAGTAEGVRSVTYGVADPAPADAFPVAISHAHLDVGMQV